MDINIDSQIVIQTAAQWAADTDVYSEKRILVTSDVYYTGTDQRKFKLANGVDTWSNLDYMPLGGSTTWGGITGTLSDQTDLQNALNNKQDLDSDLTAIAGLTPSNDDIIQRKAGSWINRTLAQLWVDLKDLTVTLTNKTLAVGSNSITGTASRVAQFGAGGSLEASSVTTTQLSYLDATSSIQTQLDSKVFTIEVGGLSLASPADSTTYYLADSAIMIPQTANSTILSVVPFNCILIAVTISTRIGNAPTNENSSFGYSKNGGAFVDYTTTYKFTTTQGTQLITGLSESFSAGDTIAHRWVTPAWVTNPNQTVLSIKYYFRPI